MVAGRRGGEVGSAEEECTAGRAASFPLVAIFFFFAFGTSVTKITRACESVGSYILISGLDHFIPASLSPKSSHLASYLIDLS